MTPADVQALEALRDRFRDYAASAFAEAGTKVDGREFGAALAWAAAGHLLDVLLHGAGHLPCPECAKEPEL